MNKVALSEREKQILRNYLLGGAGIGGGAALLASAAGYADTLRKQKDRVDTSRDDDVLYVNIPGKRPTKSASMVTGLAVAGGLSSALAAAYLARRMMQQAKKTDMQRELDLAQGSHYKQVVENATKRAAQAGGRPVGGGELFLSSPFTIAALLAAASAGVTYKTMDMKFGKSPKPTSVAPKRVVYRYTDEDTTEEKEPIEKVAFEVPFEALQGYATSFAACLAKSAGTKSALGDILGAVCQGRLGELEHNTLQNPNLALDLVKGASSAFFEAPQQLAHLAVRVVGDSAVLAPSVAMLTAAELLDNAPWASTKAASIPTEDMDEAIGQLGRVAGMETFQTVEQNEFLGTEAQAATFRELLDRVAG